MNCLSSKNILRYVEIKEQIAQLCEWYDTIYVNIQMNICEIHQEYICDGVISTQTGKIVGYKIQNSERRKVNGTGQRI